MLDGENKYNCARCKSHQMAKKKVDFIGGPKYPCNCTKAVSGW
ncbi:unnamed protein product [Rhodiola kirilowii]